MFKSNSISLHMQTVDFHKNVGHMFTAAKENLSKRTDIIVLPHIVTVG